MIIMCHEPVSPLSRGPSTDPKKKGGKPHCSFINLIYLCAPEAASELKALLPCLAQMSDAILIRQADSWTEADEGPENVQEEWR